MPQESSTAPADADARQVTMNETLQRVRDGDLQAFREVIRIYGPGVRILLASHIRDLHAAEDLAQEVFVAVYAGLDSFDPKQDPGPWIRTIARNKLMSALRRRYGPKSRLLSLHEDLRSLAVTDDSSADLENRQHQVELLRHCMARHPESERQLIQARYFTREAVQDIAIRLGTTVSAISSQLYRLRHQLRSCMEGKTRQEAR
ncbi:MAG: polymerase sigma-E factor [Verrucomicrobiota bacterium]